jgi:hypothetical protein
MMEAKGGRAGWKNRKTKRNRSTYTLAENFRIFLENEGDLD